MLKSERKSMCGWVLVTIGLMAFAPETSHSQVGRLKSSTKPTVSSISPTSATAGGASFTLTVNGTNFVSGALLQWVGSSTSSISITLVSSSQLKATIPTTLLAVAGTVQVSVYDPGKGGGTSNAAAFTINPASTPTGICVNSNFGVCGDPYEGLGPPPNQQAISACGKTIGASGNYKVSQNIGTDPTANCITINYNTTHVNLDLGGFTVTGAIFDLSGNGNTIYNGTVTCNRDQSAYPQACVDIYNQITSAQARVHHLAVQNQHELNGVWAVMFEMDNPGAYARGGSGLGMPCRADHIAMTSIAGTGVGNRYGGIVSEGNCSAELDHNYIHCMGGLLNGCQGMGVGQIPFAYLHDNEVQMDAVSGTTQDGRALMCDQGAGVNGTCDIYNNLVFASNNRAIRYREFPAGCPGGAGPWGVQHGNVYNNTISNSQETGRLGVIHVGEDDCNLMTTAINVYNNQIELNGGNGIVVVSANGVTAFGNTFTCFGGNCSGGGWPMFTDALGYSGGQTKANFKNNSIPSGITNAVKVCGPPGNLAYACTTPETSAATVCSTGTVVGNGTITAQNSPCP